LIVHDLDANEDFTHKHNHDDTALFGLLSDEEGIFKDDRFKGMPIANVLDTYTNYHQSLVPSQANYSLALTHQSLVRDMELANHVLNTHGGETAGLLIGGHEHEPYDEVVKKEGIDNGVLPGVDTMRIVKSGMDCNAVNLIDLSFDVEDEKSPKLVEASAELVEMAQFEPSVVVKKIVDKHMAVLDSLENEVIVDISTIPFLPPGVPISSERTRFQQTTLGSIFCTFIKEELETGE
jgi:2',3'-cyclic-nucleotide 2'-phosphodiesterase (5'-nucleotidase family)